MAQKRNKSSSGSMDRAFTLFQDKKFTVVFFLLVFGLLGGVFYLLQTNAAATVNVNVCTVYGSIGRNKGGVSVNAYLGTTKLGGQTVGKDGKFSFEMDGLNKLSNMITVTKSTGNKGGTIATITAGPCTSTARAPFVDGCTVSGSIGINTGGYSVEAYLDTRRLGGQTVGLYGNYSFQLSELNKLSNTIEIMQTIGTKGGPIGTITAGPCI